MIFVTKISLMHCILYHVILGAFVGGLLTSGDLFLWHKVTDTLKFVTGLPDFAQQPLSTYGKTNSNRSDWLFVLTLLQEVVGCVMIGSLCP